MAIFRIQLTRLGIAAAALSLSHCAQRVSIRETPLTPSASPVVSSPAIAQCRVAYRKLQAGDFSAETIGQYNTSVGRVIEKAAGSFPLESEDRDLEIFDRETGTRISIGVAPGISWVPTEIESLQAADTLTIRGLRERVQVSGIGAPIVAKISATPDRRFIASSGFFLPSTAILEFSESGDATLTFHDPTQSPSVRFLGKARPLQADFTAPIATTYARRDRQMINVPAMFKFDKFQESHGMFRLGAIYPDKIPVVFVHGLKSNPDTWRDPVNELMDDPVIRDRFEFWNFGYATGPAIPFSAMQLRESLREMADYRKSVGATTSEVILVGHSMGGLLSGLMTQSSGDESWFKLFEKPLDELELPEADRDLLRRMAYYEPLPFVRRVVFIATPHGGSKFAANPISRIASGLIQVPGALLTLSTDLLKAGITVLTPIGREVVREVPTSIDTLRADSELVRLFRSMPSNPNVTHHSIIGEDDAVAPYESTHIDEAVSEKLVPAGHEAHQHPEAIEEMRRILREHAGR